MTRKQITEFRWRIRPDGLSTMVRGNPRGTQTFTLAHLSVVNFPTLAEPRGMLRMLFEMPILKEQPVEDAQLTAILCKFARQHGIDLKSRRRDYPSVEPKYRRVTSMEFKLTNGTQYADQAILLSLGLWQLLGIESYTTEYADFSPLSQTICSLGRGQWIYFDAYLKMKHGLQVQASLDDIYDPVKEQNWHMLQW